MTPPSDLREEIERLVARLEAPAEFGNFTERDALRELAAFCYQDAFTAINKVYYGEDANLVDRSYLPGLQLAKEIIALRAKVMM